MNNKSVTDKPHGSIDENALQGQENGRRKWLLISLFSYFLGGGSTSFLRPQKLETFCFFSGV